MKSHPRSRLSQRRKALPLSVAHAVGPVHVTPVTSHESQFASHESQPPFRHRSSRVTRHCLNQALAKHNRKPPQSTENNHRRPQSIASFCRDFRESRSPAPAVTTHHARISTYFTPTAHSLIGATAIRNLRNSQHKKMTPNSNQLFFGRSAREQYCFDPSPFAAIIVPLTHCELSGSAPSGLREP